MKANLKRRFFRCNPGCFPLLTAFLLVLLVCLPVKASAAGWEKNGSQIRFIKDDGTALTGYAVVNRRHFYFDKNGIMKTGWVRFGSRYRYFRKYGSVGVKGRQFSGLHVINGRTFLFRSNGVLVTAGLTEYKGHTYYFRKTGHQGLIGMALKSRWAKSDGAYYYFDENGWMQQDQWVKDTYYVGSDGKRLASSLTPDGYWVGADGKRVGDNSNGWREIDGNYYYYSKKKGRFLSRCFLTVSGKKYYISSKGIRVTGPARINGDRYFFDRQTGEMQFGVVEINGKRYYYGADGKMVINDTEDIYTTDENGVIISVGKRNILVIAGHGQGDPGAVSSLGKEYLYTRQFAKMIVDKLKATGKVNVDYYKNGSTSYDMYQRSKAAFTGVKHPGDGSNKAQVISVLKSNKDLMNYTKYSYVLEIHFNALAVNLKDEKGDGSYHGIGFFLSAHRIWNESCKMEKEITKSIEDLGFLRWAGGVTYPNGYEDYHNMSICREVGTPYGLLETAFIDDRDDMKFYVKHRNQMAEIIAKSIVRYYG